MYEKLNLENPFAKHLAATMLITSLVLFIVSLSWLFADWMAEKSRRKQIPRPQIPARNDDTQVEYFLLKHTPYFLRLHPEDQRLFVFRVKEFIQHNKFETAGNLLLRDDMMLAVAALVVQTGMGCSKWNFPPVKGICLARPETELAGTNLEDKIVLLWDSAENKLSSEADSLKIIGRVLFARAYSVGDDFFEYYLRKWWMMASDHYPEHSDPAVIFGENLSAFFTGAKKFEAASPELYQITAILLNQDSASDGKISFDATQRRMSTNIPAKTFSELLTFSFSIFTSLRSQAAAAFFLVANVLIVLLNFYSPDRLPKLLSGLAMFAALFLICRNYRKFRFQPSGLEVNYRFRQKTEIIQPSQILLLRYHWNFGFREKSSYRGTLYWAEGRKIYSVTGFGYEKPYTNFILDCRAIREAGIPVLVDNGPFVNKDLFSKTLHHF